MLHSRVWETRSSLGNSRFLGKALLLQPRPARAAPLHGIRGQNQPGAPGDGWKAPKLPPVPPPARPSAKLRVRFAAPVAVSPSPPARGCGSAQPCSSLARSSVFSWIQRIPSSGMRRNFKPTCHPQRPPSSLCWPWGPGWVLGCVGSGQGSLSPFCHFPVGDEAKTRLKCGGREAAQGGQSWRVQT